MYVNNNENVYLFIQSNQEKFLIILSGINNNKAMSGNAKVLGTRDFFVPSLNIIEKKYVAITIQL